MRRILGPILPMLLIALGAIHLLIFLTLLWRRLPYPYDLEWMEGGMLLHAQRIAQGKPLYGPPLLEFVPYVYPPLYPAVLALLSCVTGIGYTAGRVVSVLALGAALGLGYRASRGIGTDRPTAATAMIAVLAAFPFVGAWFDLVRNDELCLALAMAGLSVLLLAPKLGSGRAFAGALLVAAALWTKQTAAAFILAGLLVVLLRAWRRVPLYVAGLVACWAVPAWLLDRKTSGWFWTWTMRVPSRHAFYAHRAFLETPMLLIQQAPAIWAGGLAAFVVLARRRRLAHSQLAWCMIGLLGASVAAVGFGKQWAFSNAYIPGVFFPLVALAGLAGAKRLPAIPSDAKELYPWPTLLVQLGLIVHLATHLYDPRPHMPTEADLQAGSRLMERLATIKGEVLMPYHPFYPVKIGKPAYLHRMGMLDARGAGLPAPAGLDRAIAEQRFDVVIQDTHVRFEEWPGLLEQYRMAERLVVGTDAPRSFAGADTAPAFVLTRDDREREP